MSGRGSHVVTLAGTGATFACPGDQVVLKAALAAGQRAIPSGCHGGGCGVCRVRVLAGPYRVGRMSRAHVTEADEAAGFTLACKTFPEGALVVGLAPSRT
ncbi:MAG: 2Fe-2S iron-sulfur cluster binding domain-containing protein [Acidimicrobiia bacterium]|nr:2Fe-2S iron-sulfur cluster binding domain-containing protein [Acidimicrobiia bacterium]